MKIHIFVDNQFYVEIDCNKESADVNSAYGISGAHRFAEYIDLAPGTYNVALFALNSVSNDNNVVLGPSLNESKDFKITIENTVPTPATPTGVKVDFITTNAAKISWNAVDGADGYTIVVPSSGASKTTTGTSVVIDGLTPGSLYEFQVSAYVFGTDGVPHDGSYASVEKRTMVQSPSNVVAKDVTLGTIKLEWDAVEGADGYEVSRRTGTDETYSYVVLDEVTDPSRVCPYLSVGTAYQFRVRYFYMVDGVKTYSDYSAPVTKNITISAPTGLKTTELSATSATLSWNAIEGVSGYEVSRRKGKSSEYDFISLDELTKTSRVCSNLAPGTTYTFKIRGYVIKNGNKVYGSAATIYVTTRLTAPVLNVTRPNASNANVRLNWTAVKGATGYKVERAESSEGPWTTVYSGTKLTYLDTNGSVNKRYYYRVSASNNGDSSIVRSMLIPTKPTNLRITATSKNSISLTWNTVPGSCIMYEVWRSRSKDSGYVCLGRYNTNFKKSTSLSAGTTYYYKVRAYFYYYDSDGGVHRIYSDYTPVLSGTTRR
ncbi:MAG TPA: hypothetical protein DCW41_05300 [Clostridiales bacterium]|nr:hypothetical protein [Clostridiales bacterium]